jgi:hypothetical protein
MTSEGEQDYGGLDFIEHAMLLRDPARPVPAHAVLEEFGFSGSTERVANHVFDETHDPQGNTRVEFDPVGKILPEIPLQDNLSFRARLGAGSYAAGLASF